MTGDYLEDIIKKESQFFRLKLQDARPVVESGRPLNCKDLLRIIEGLLRAQNLPPTGFPSEAPPDRNWLVVVLKHLDSNHSFFDWMLLRTNPMKITSLRWTLSKFSFLIRLYDVTHAKLLLLFIVLFSLLEAFDRLPARKSGRGFFRIQRTKNLILSQKKQLRASINTESVPKNQVFQLFSSIILASFRLF